VISFESFLDKPGFPRPNDGGDRAIMANRRRQVFIMDDYEENFGIYCLTGQNRETIFD
jgi:hypothetical protein